VKDEKGFILDGFARAQITRELGYECPSVTVSGLSEQEKRSQVRALNLARRHLDHAEKRRIIADEIKENPDRSNRWIAKSLGVHHATVIAVRDALASTGHVDRLGVLLGSDGKYRPATNEKSFFRLVTDHFHPRASNQETPAGVARFLFDLISPAYEVKIILDPCAGDGALTSPWNERRLIAFEIEQGKDFFRCPDRIGCDLVLCNPPFTQAQDSPGLYPPERFLRRIALVVPPKTPIAMIVPMCMRLNQTRGSKRWRWLRDEAPAITSIVSLPRDVFGAVDFHCEILLFNMPRLKPHYFLPDGYL
jgi:type I restriction enzyme M protein